jgi:hypothetical protein
MSGLKLVLNFYPELFLPRLRVTHLTQRCSSALPTQEHVRYGSGKNSIRIHIMSLILPGLAFISSRL